MKRQSSILKLCLCILVSWISVIRFGYADVELSESKQLNLDSRPLEIVTSADGQSIYVLVPGEILVYSISKDKIINRIAINDVFDKLIHSEKANLLILSSSSSASVNIIQIEKIHDIDISGLPFKGAAEAPVIIAIFSDYQ